MSMFCHRCGQQLPSDALFCNHCGTKLQNSRPGISNASPSGRVTIQFDDTDTTTQYARPTRDLREFEAAQPTNSPEPFGNSPNTSPNQFPPHVSYTTPIPPSQSNISGTQYPPIWQIATEPPTQQIRTSTPEPPPIASNRVQEVLLRIFGANLSTRPLFGIALGGVLAAVSGLLVTALLLSIAHALAPQIATSASGANGEDIVDYVLGLYPLHNLYRDSLQFFLVMHGVGTHIQSIGSAGTSFYTSDAYFPLYGLLIVPALLLIFSGYVAASTDFQHRIKHSLWLGYPKPNVQITSAATGTSLLGSTLQFSAQSSGRDINYTWVFGDGSVGTGPTVTHAFTANGNFTVSVTAYDTLDQSSTSTTNVVIVPPPPQANFTIASIYYGYVTLDASGSSADPSTSIATYNWNFGDGNTDPNGSSQEYHQYYSVGTYQVTLIVTDSVGQSSSAYTGNVTIS